MRTILSALLAFLLTAGGTTVSVFAQTPAVPGPTTQVEQVRRLTADEAVQLALENNLGIQASRLEPQIQDLSVAQARAAWTPAFRTSMQQNSAQSPPNSFLSGAQGTLSDQRFTSSTGVQQLLSWGGNYTLGWDNARSTSNSVFSSFNPQIRSSLAFNYTQPLMRGFGIDATRQQLLTSVKSREIADVQLRQNIAATSRTVRNAYWNLAYAIASLAVQQQSFDLANESLRNTRARIEIGTLPPIDVVEAESEVAAREEAVIVAQAQIDAAQDTLRALVFDPTTPEFWTLRMVPSELPPFQPTVVNVDAAIRNALDRRTDLQQTRKTLESNDINITYLRNQLLPEVNASFDYGLSGLGGIQFARAPGTGLTPGDVTGQTQRGFGSVLGDLFLNAFPTWTASLNVSYPIGTSQADANLARVRLQQNQTLTRLRNQEVQVMTQVRQAARQVTTNQQRVQTLRSSRELAERRLEAEQRKLAAGTSTSFVVFQAQRDLAVARNNELRAILDYNQSIVDLETVQEVPLGGAQ